jgi:hypothetical protein
VIGDTGAAEVQRHEHCGDGRTAEQRAADTVSGLDAERCEGRRAERRCADKGDEYAFRQRSALGLAVTPQSCGVLHGARERHRQRDDVGRDGEAGPVGEGRHERADARDGDGVADEARRPHPGEAVPRHEHRGTAEEHSAPIGTAVDGVEVEEAVGAEGECIEVDEDEREHGDGLSARAETTTTEEGRGGERRECEGADDDRAPDEPVVDEREHHEEHGEDGEQRDPRHEQGDLHARAAAGAGGLGEERCRLGRGLELGRDRGSRGGCSDKRCRADRCRDGRCVYGSCRGRGLGADLGCRRRRRHHGGGPHPSDQGGALVERCRDLCRDRGELHGALPA